MRNNTGQLEEFVKKTDKRTKERQKKRKPRMKISGKSVFKLQEIVRKKRKKS